MFLGSLTLTFETFLFWVRIRGDIRNRKTSPRLVFDYEYLREFEAKCGTARKVVQGIYEEPISAKPPVNPPHCHVPLNQ